jgi:hypothetical protein
MVTNQQAAKVYADKLGWSVIPVVKQTKRPAVEWKEYQTNPANQEQIEDWWRDEDYNVGIVTGSVSNLCVVDFDGPGATGLVKLPRTATVATPHGEHWYYQYREGDIGNQARFLSVGDSAVDIRCEGGYIVAPPSLHEVGERYEWRIRPSEVIEPLPEDLRAELLFGRIERQEESLDNEWYDKVMGGVAEGQRNDAATRVAGYWLRITDCNREATFKALRLWNTQNTPPLPEQELRTVVASVAARQERVEPTRGARLYTIDEVVSEITTEAPRLGVKVDIPGIDEIGGLVPGEMIVVAGRPGMGKSTYATQMCVEAGARTGIPTLVATCEMTRKMWGAWMASHAGNYSLNQEETKPVPEKACTELVGKSIFLLDAGVNIETIGKYARTIPGLGLIVVDHVGLVTPKKRDQRTLEVSDIVIGLHELAKDLDCTVLLLSQLNREIEKRESPRPKMSDLRECGEIEQTAAHILFLHGQTTKPTRKLIVGKSRFRSNIPDVSIMFGIDNV